MDRIETNFRLLMISQRELSVRQKQMNAKLAAVATQVGTIAGNLATVASQMAVMATQMAAVETQMIEVAELAQASAVKSDETADRIEETLGVVLSFAEGQAEIRVKQATLDEEQAEMRATLAECVRRLDALEGKKAS